MGRRPFPLADLVPGPLRGVILDGVHRLLQAELAGRATLPAKILRPEHLDRIAVP
ncbi:hypothetical protein AB0I28_15580 [Phytomonospora sp. NPDC050363]|uniref:hypothetical protein n=1 Tax=Phytomonospora sp. NPDC050363 TaxID=3155642 RepID=UPI0033FFEB82